MAVFHIWIDNRNNNRMTKTSGIGFDWIIEQIESTLADTAWFPKSPSDCQIIYRGEPALYKTNLLPKIFRPSTTETYSEAYLFEEFQRRHPEFHSLCHNELDWLNVMQHNNVPTRLLDWTAALPIGLYFASESMPVASDSNLLDDSGVLYYQVVTPDATVNPANQSKARTWDGYKHAISKLVQAKNQNDVAEWCEVHYQAEVIRDSFLYRPTHFHDRVKNQQGLFTVSIGKHLHNFSFLEAISPHIECLEKPTILERFVEQIDVYWCKYQAEDDIPKIIRKFKCLLSLQDEDNNKYSALMLVNEHTKKITVYISILDSAALPTPARVTHIEGYSDAPVLTPKNENTIRSNAAILIAALRGTNPMLMTNVLNAIKKTIELSNEDLLPPDVCKIIIPNKEKQKLKQRLALMGINFSNLFPEPSNFYKGLNERFYKLPNINR